MNKKTKAKLEGAEGSETLNKTVSKRSKEIEGPDPGRENPKEEGVSRSPTSFWNKA